MFHVPCVNITTHSQVNVAALMTPLFSTLCLPADIKQELLKLNKGLLFLFIELLEVLVKQPSAYAALLSELNITLNNMAHLLNMARPLQVRE
jgi:hypothetical protein